MLTSTEPTRHANGRPERISDAQILELKAQGWTSAQIAEHAGLSVHGINYRLRALRPPTPTVTSTPTPGQEPEALEALREQLYYWQNHAATYRTRYTALRAALTPKEN